MRNRPVRQLTLIGLAASIVGVGLALLIDWFPTQGSSEASQIDTLYDVLLAVSITIFVLVMVVAIYSVIRWRARPGDQRDGPPIHGNARLEVVWVAIPFLLVTSLAIYGWIVLVDIEDPQPDAMVVEVRAEQFTWSFAYPDEDEAPPVRSNELLLPIDRQVEFEIQTEDVIHSFWVPAFRLKSDTVPGITTTVRLTPSEEGTFEVVCAELCGIGHSTMRQSVTVLPGEEFDSWLAERREALAGEGVAGGEAGEGQSPSGLAGQSAPEDDGGAAEDGGAGGGGGGPEEDGGAGGSGQGGAGSGGDGEPDGSPARGSGGGGGDDA